jgi:hypothetical protein
LLTAQEKAALSFLVSELVEADEPMAMLAVVQRIAERMAFRGAKAQNFEIATRWQELADTLGATVWTLKLHERPET